MAKIFMPKCLECKERIQAIKKCQKCWIRKGEQLAMLIAIDVKKYWRAIPATWKDRSFLNFFFGYFRSFLTFNQNLIKLTDQKTGFL